MSGSPINKVLVYGTLRVGEGAYNGFGLDRKAKHLGTVRIEGSMYHLGGYPGVKLDGNPNGFVADLLELTDDGVLEQLDGYEGYRPNSPNSSLYIRQTVDLSDGTRAYIYEYNQHVGGRPRMESGDWKKEKTGT